MNAPRYVKKAEIIESDERLAVARLVEAITQPDMGGVIFFCSAEWDLQQIAKIMGEKFHCPVIGCTTAGEIGPHYIEGGIVGLSLSAEVFRLHPIEIRSLRNFSLEMAKKMAMEIQPRLHFSDSLDKSRMFGFLLVDGLSEQEEKIVAYLYQAMQGISIVGGSAGDNLKFQETKIYSQGRFLNDTAVFTVIETLLPFKTFKLQHFEPSDKDMVVTEADPLKRIVYEIDGGPAATEYADILNLNSEKLSPQVFSKYPVMLQIGDEWFVRSIQKVNDDNSLTFYCAIDNGLPLTIAKGVGFVESLEKIVEEFKLEFGEIELTLGCDCILRRLEIQDSNNKKDVETLLGQINFMGFSTFGEQFNSIHVNQTLTGVVFGR
ncbi:MAG: hypothetical protein DWQ05_04215 [Calditrichaeota bacterium]|nr:MAG: hypothetical protein DWQ05_04215 [Calditrichota bacterium]